MLKNDLKSDTRYTYISMNRKQRTIKYTVNKTYFWVQGAFNDIPGMCMNLKERPTPDYTTLIHVLPLQYLCWCYSLWSTSKGGWKIKRKRPESQFYARPQRSLVHFYCSTDGLTHDCTLPGLLWDKTKSKQKQLLWESHVTTVYIIPIKCVFWTAVLTYQSCPNTGSGST